MYTCFLKIPSFRTMHFPNTSDRVVWKYGSYLYIHIYCKSRFYLILNICPNFTNSGPNVVRVSRKATATRSSSASAVLSTRASRRLCSRRLRRNNTNSSRPPRNIIIMLRAATWRNEVWSELNFLSLKHPKSTQSTPPAMVGAASKLRCEEDHTLTEGWQNRLHSKTL